MPSRTCTPHGVNGPVSDVSVPMTIGSPVGARRSRWPVSSSRLVSAVSAVVVSTAVPDVAAVVVSVRLLRSSPAAGARVRSGRRGRRSCIVIVIVVAARPYDQGEHGEHGSRLRASPHGRSPLSSRSHGRAQGLTHRWHHGARHDHTTVPCRPRRQPAAPAGGARRPPTAGGRRDQRRRAARRRGRGDRRRRAQAGGDRDAVDHRRRVPPRLVPPRLPPAARRRRRHRQHRRQLGRRRHRAHDAAEAVRHRSAAPRPRHPGRRLRVPRVGRARDDAEGVHPVADDGPLPRRAGGDRHRGVPRPRRLLRRPGGVLPRRDRRAVRRRLPLPAARRHQPRLPLRPGDAPGCRRPRGRPGHAAAHVRRR